MNQFLIIGQGAIGAQVSNWLVDKQQNVTGMARQERRQYMLDDNVAFIQADASQLTTSQKNKMAKFSHIVIIVTPSDYSSQGYEQSYLAIANQLKTLVLPNLLRLVFISSTGVYGQNNGELIDENTLPKLPSRASSQIILRAEQLLQQAFGDKCVIIRPSGIYGIQRLMRIRKAKQDNKSPMAEQAWTNRIMDTDLVSIIGNVLIITHPKPLYLATDYAPVTSLELMTWLCEQLGTEPPIRLINDNNIAKQVSGKRIYSNIPKEWLMYPDWKTGYAHILSML